MTYNTIPNFENYETSINIPFLAPILELKKLLNENIPADFSGNDQNIIDILKNDELTYNFSRTDITFTTNDDKIIFTTNVTGLARIKGRLDLKLFKTKVSAHADIRGQIVGEISLSLNEEWKLNPSIQLSINIADAKIPIKGIGGRISIRSSLTRKINRKLDKISDNLLLKISENIDIEKSAKKIWQKLHITKKINSDPPVWIKIKPKSIVFKNFDMSDGKNISSGIGIRANIETFIARNITSPITISSLPYLHIQNNISDQFIIYLPIHLSIDLINENFSYIINNQKFDISDNVKIIIKKIKLIPNGEKITIKLDFKSEENTFIDSIDGVISLEGNIYYDNVENSIKLINLDYDLEAQRSLISIASWLLKPILLSKIEKKLVFSLTSELEKLEFKVKRLLDNVRLPQDISSSISVEKIELDSVILKYDYIYLISLCHGSISAALFKSVI